MQRRTYLKAAFTGAAASALLPAANTPKGRIQLHLDLAVPAANEKRLLQHFHDRFKPAASKFQGYISVDLLKLRSALTGSAPAAKYRFVLVYENEELRQKWVASDVHQQVWPPIEKMLAHTNYSVLLYDYA